jgi:hypothetical protein
MPGFGCHHAAGWAVGSGVGVTVMVGAGVCDAAGFEMAVAAGVADAGRRVGMAGWVADETADAGPHPAAENTMVKMQHGARRDFVIIVTNAFKAY